MKLQVLAMIDCVGFDMFNHAVKIFFIFYFFISNMQLRFQLLNMQLRFQLLNMQLRFLRDNELWVGAVKWIRDLILTFK